MKEFDITLNAVSEKTFRLRAGTRDEALMLVEAILENSDLLNFSEDDVDSLEIDCQEVCGGVCEVCANACENCGNCTELEPDCDHPEQDCEYRCPVCGCCMAEDADDDEDE